VITVFSLVSFHPGGNCRPPSASRWRPGSLSPAPSPAPSLTCPRPSVLLILLHSGSRISVVRHPLFLAFTGFFAARRPSWKGVHGCAPFISFSTEALIFAAIFPHNLQGSPGSLRSFRRPLRRYARRSFLTNSPSRGWRPCGPYLQEFCLSACTRLSQPGKDKPATIFLRRNSFFLDSTTLREEDSYYFTI